MKEHKISNDRYIVKIKRKYIILNSAGLYLLKLIETKNAKDIVKLICKKYCINEVEAIEQIQNFNRMLANENNFIDTDLLNLNKPLNIQWKITNKCNLNCLHCYNRNEIIESIDENNRDQIFNEILKTKPLSVLFTGGEPLTCSKTIEYMKKAFDTGIEVRLFTNGTLISDQIKTLAYMKDNLIVNISIDGDEKTHELIRGVNSYNLVRDNILKLVNAEISTSINMVINKLNFKSFIDVVKDLYSIGVKSIQFSHLTLSGNALKNHAKLVMTDSDYLEFDNDINKNLIPLVLLNI